MTFYFYDLETTGLRPFADRIIQFGGQRVDANLEPLEEPQSFYIKLASDILPSPGAVLVHQILPHQANSEGVSEAQFVDWLNEYVYHQDTVYTGFNSIPFDDEFMRSLHWRNFADDSPILQQSLDIYRLAVLTADLRPEGIKWPEPSASGKLDRTLTGLTQANQLQDDTHPAHSAQGDVLATIALAKLIKKVQPKLFDHCLNLLQPAVVADIISQQPFVYNYHNSAFKTRTTLATVLSEHPTKVGCYIVYDLRCPVQNWSQMTADQIVLALQKRSARTDSTPIPFSILDINRAPVVAPENVLDASSRARLNLTNDTIKQHWQQVQQSSLNRLISDAFLKLSQLTSSTLNFEQALAATPVSDADAARRRQVRATAPAQLTQLDLPFDNANFKRLQFLYQARNFPHTLSADQLNEWESYRQQIFFQDQPGLFDVYSKELQRQASRLDPDVDIEKYNLLEDLQVYVSGILPPGQPRSSSFASSARFTRD